MFIKKLSILGYRGFQSEAHLNLAIPNGHEGSGVTVLVGPNNSGKSTVLESLRLISSRNYMLPTFPTTKRNQNAGDRVKLTILSEDGRRLMLETVPQGGSEAVFNENEIQRKDFNLFYLPSRRTFTPYFGKDSWTRDMVMQSGRIESQRGAQYDMFQRRIFHIQKDPTEFNSILSEVLGYKPDWTIDQSGEGNYYIKFNFKGNFHDSDGAGEGLLSVLTIVDAFYDSTDGDIIVIDEPELSLHPALQKRVLNLIMRYSASRQVLISTHSPFFIDWQSLMNGGSIVRSYKSEGEISLYQTLESAGATVSKLLGNLNNPHLLGLDAKEIFFLDDGIVIVEGQEDVIFYNKILRIIDMSVNGNFFGWGIGGADNLPHILGLLQSLGFKKVTCILDNDKEDVCNANKDLHPDYHFVNIPAKDVRDKPTVKERPEVYGLINSSGKEIKAEFIEPLKTMFIGMNNYLSS